MIEGCNSKVFAFFLNLMLTNFFFTGMLYENIISKSRDDLASLDATEDEYNTSSNNSITDGDISLPVSGNESDDDFPGYFEGPEKTMEVVFRPDKVYYLNRNPSLFYLSLSLS